MNDGSVQGGVGIIGRIPAQQERLDTGFAAEVSRPIAKSFVAILYGVFSFLGLFAIAIVIGPAVLRLLVYAIIITSCLVFARWLAHWVTDESQYKTYFGLLAVDMLVCAGLMAFVIHNDSALIALWPPISLEWDAWVKFIVIVCLAIMVIVLAFMAFSFLVNAYNPAAFQPYQARREGSTWWLPTGRAMDSAPDESESMTREEIAELLAEAMDKKPIVRQDRIILANRKQNGNGLHASPTPGTDERLDQEEVEHVVRETDGRGHSYIYVVKGNQSSAKVSTALVEDFVRQAPIVGSSFRIWAARGVTEAKLRTIRRALEIYGIVDLGDATIHEELEWLLKPDEALEEFERIFMAQAPSE